MRSLKWEKEAKERGPVRWPFEKDSASRCWLIDKGRGQELKNRGCLQKSEKAKNGSSPRASEWTELPQNFDIIPVSHVSDFRPPELSGNKFVFYINKFEITSYDSHRKLISFRLLLKNNWIIWAVHEHFPFLKNTSTLNKARVPLLGPQPWPLPSRLPLLQR